jgi:solute carrier family 50 protein (sugar transporter)
MKHEPSIWSCNGVGVVLAIYYCLQFALNVPKTKQSSILEASTPTLPGTVKQHVQGVTAVIAGTTFLAIFKPFADNTANLIGNIAVLFCILMFASPLSVIRVVLQTKSAKSIPLPFTVVSCLNCFMWVVFGWFKLKDVNVYLPNVLGLTFGVIQVALKLMFGDKDGLPAYAGVGIAP